MIMVLNLAWHVLIKGDKINSLQFAKVIFPIKILIVTNLPEFSPDTILHYTVLTLTPA